jgi:uncharacterized membrane protein YeaQ/YmgE (transglycosylase-associated protein family)
VANYALLAARSPWPITAPAAIFPAERSKEDAMSIITWIIIGAVMGLLANWLVPGRFPGGFLGTVTGGVAGAFFGGAVFSLLVGRGVSGFDPISLVIAFVGAALLLTLLRAVGFAAPRAR